MPIKGLTDNIRPAFPIIGKLRKGGEKGPKGIGPDLSYFRFTSERPEIVRAFHEAYGDQPTLINVFLPYITPDENFSVWKEKWVAGGMIHRCDGETMSIWLGPDHRYHREPAPCPYHSSEKSDSEQRSDPPCEEVGRLSLMIPELIREGYVGYVSLETHSIHDIRSIYATLLATSEARHQNPYGLRGVQFVLRRVPETISVPGWGNNAGKRQRTQKFLVKLEPAASWVENQLSLMRVEASPQLSPGEPKIGEDSNLVDYAVDVVDAEAADSIVEDGIPVDVPDLNLGEQLSDADCSEATTLPVTLSTSTAQQPMALDEALLVQTPRGKPFAELTNYQLGYVLAVIDSKPESERTVEEVRMRTAAFIVLSSRAG